jgi:hypothetical protein
MTASTYPPRRKPGHPAARALPALGLWMLLAAFGSGCSLLRNTVELPVRAAEAMIPGIEQTESVDPVELQEQLLRFADNFISATLVSAEKLRRDGQPVGRAELLEIKLMLASEALAMATGANALANLVDLVVLTSVARIRVEDYWRPRVYGDSALPMLNALRTRESQIWELAKTVLNPAQQAELRAAIEQWRREKSSGPGSLSVFASVGLVAEVTKSGRQQASALPSSVFALLDIDPLAGLDPATRELAQTRLFAERAMYIGQRMPQLLEWQMELLTLRTAAVPEVQQLVANSTQLAAAGDRLSRVAEQTPALISSEREKIVAALASREQGLTGLAREVGLTMAQGAKMADSADAALKTFHGVAAQFDAGPSEPAPPGEPFRIKDYAETAVQISLMAQRLTELLNALQPNLNPDSFARISARADVIAQRTQRRGEEVVDYAFGKALLFVAISSVIVLAASLAYRLVSARIRRT